MNCDECIMNSFVVPVKKSTSRARESVCSGSETSDFSKSGCMNVYIDGQ